LQEVAIDSFKLYGYQEIVNLNPQKRGTAILCKESFKIGDVVKLADGRGIAMEVEGVLFVNVYAPWGSQNRQERAAFFEKGITPLLRRYQGKAVFGGDFNCVIDKNECWGRGICQSLAEVVNG